LILLFFSGFKLNFVSGALGAQARARRHWREAVCGAMVTVWSIAVLFLIVQLFEFRQLTGKQAWGLVRHEPFR